MLIFSWSKSHTCRDGLNCIHYAAKRGHTDILEIMIEEVDEMNVNVRTQMLDWTPLHYASFGGHVTTAKTLLQEGADVNSITHEGKFPLMLAVSQGHRKAAGFLIQHGSDVNMQDQRGYTVLHECVNIQSMNNIQWTVKQQYQMVELLLMTGADVSLCDAMGETALHVALRSGTDKQVVHLLLCVEPSAKGNEVYDSLKSLIHKTNNSGQTAFMLSKSIDCMKLLLKRTPNINHRSNDGRTALHSAVNDIKLVDFLLANEADAEIQDLQGRCPLHLSINADVQNPAVVLALLEHMVRPDITDSAGDTPLHILTKKARKQDNCSFHQTDICDNELAVMATLLRKHVKIDIQNKKGQTPLHIAIINRRYDFAQMLLKSGADSTLKDCKEVTAESINPRWFQKYRKSLGKSVRPTPEPVLSSRQVSFAMKPAEQQDDVADTPDSGVCDLPKWVTDGETDTSITDASVTDSVSSDKSIESDSVLHPSKKVTFNMDVTIRDIPVPKEIEELPQTNDELGVHTDHSKSKVNERKKTPMIETTEKPNSPEPPKLKPKIETKKFPVFGAKGKKSSAFSFFDISDDDEEDSAPQMPKKQNNKINAVTVTREISSLKEQVDEVKDFLEEFSKEATAGERKTKQKKTVELTRQITSLHKDMADVKKLLEDYG